MLLAFSIGLAAVGAQPTAEEMILFHSTRRGTFGVYVMNADGSDQRLVSPEEARAYHPRWSADGTRIYFEADLETGPGVCSVDLDGNDLQIHDTIDGGIVSWQSHPDGRRFYAKDLPVDGGKEGETYRTIWVCEADGSNPAQFIPEGMPGSDPRLSPDGSLLLFGSDADGNRDLYVISTDGGEPRNVTDNDLFNKYGRWAPDGDTIYFAMAEPDANSDIHAISVDGTGLTQLLDTPEQFEDELSVSADGTRIAYQTKLGEQHEVFVLDIESGETTRLTDSPRYDAYPVFGPASN